MQDTLDFSISSLHFMSKAHFAKNLRTLCDEQRSVAQVCRSIGINRQQFNKYLSGQVLPSHYNLSSICEFFDVDKETLLLSPLAFNIALSRRSHAKKIRDNLFEHVINALPNNTEIMKRYEGYYHTYFHALGFPGYIMRGLICIYRVDDAFYSKNIEHLWDKSDPHAVAARFKYYGSVQYLSDRLFLTECEALSKHNITHTILVPSYRNAGSMSGITLGVASLNSHLPKAVRIEYQYLGKKINIREGLRACGIFHIESDQISEDIKERINNEILPHEHALTVND